MKISKLFVAFTLICSALSPAANAVVPAPDGAYPNFTTAEGDNALKALTTGSGNTGLGWHALFSAGAANFNTAVGGGALVLNTGDSNTAVGAAALLLNTMGTRNTATGTDALVFNSTGNDNTAIGAFALENSTTDGNTATGAFALYQNTTGSLNVAVGSSALGANTTGIGNIALGNASGKNITTASDVICIGADGDNVDNSCYIGHIFGATSVNGIGVLVNPGGRLGTTTSSRRFKDDIKPMDKASEALLALKPVTFHYKKEIDPGRTSQFGLVAEEVEKVNPDLIVRDKEGKPYSVRYDQVNAMLLNEFLKAHRKMEDQNRKMQQQETMIAQLKKEIETVTVHAREQDSKIEQVNDRIEINKLGAGRIRHRGAGGGLVTNDPRRAASNTISR